MLCCVIVSTQREPALLDSARARSSAGFTSFGSAIGPSPLAAHGFASPAKSGSGRTGPCRYALGLVGAAQFRHAVSDAPVVVIGAVVVHHDQHRDLILGGDPEPRRRRTSGRRPAGCRPRCASCRDARARRRARCRSASRCELGARMAIRLVEIPELADLALEIVGGQHQSSSLMTSHTSMASRPR